MIELRGYTCALWIPTLLLAGIGGCTGAGEIAPDGRGAAEDETALAGSDGAPGGDAVGQPQNAGTATVMVHLVPRAGVSGQQRVNFAVPLPRGMLSSIANVRVRRAGADVATGRRALASYSDGSLRSVQIQFDAPDRRESDVEVRIGEAAVGSVALVPVANTLASSNGAQVPKVWASLPAAWLSSTGVFGPQVTEASVAGTPLSAWSDLCDYEAFDNDAFMEEKADGAVWLYDRGTTMYRGYARGGEGSPLYTAYRETSIYRAGITGSGSSTDIGVPGKAGDLKYFYVQNMALHYLLSGDDRFRESAEQIAGKVGDLFDPWYEDDGPMWTERNAGFMLLAYVWAAIVSDNRAAEFAALADDTVDAVLDLQAANPPGGYANQNARCFSHSADSHAEDYGYWGCSPWMSAILADGLDAYASERSGARQTAARQSIVKLGRILAAQGRDGDGRPYYWMGVGTNSDEADDWEEHWGESAYIIAMAWYHGGKQENALKTAANQLVTGFHDVGEAPHIRSFNWQCRSAVATPFYLK